MHALPPLLPPYSSLCDQPKCAPAKSVTVRTQASSPVGVMSFVPSTKPRSNAELLTETSIRLSPVLDGLVNVEEQGAELSLTIKSLPGEGIRAMFDRLAVTVRESAATIVHLMVFGSVNASAAGKHAMERVLGKTDWPVTWVEGAACDGRPITGMQIFAVVGGEVRRVTLNGRIVGSVFENGPARHCQLGGLGPNETSGSPATQTRQTLENLEAALAQAGFSLADTVRTWFYLDDLLSWYGEFNQARTQAYARTRFRSGALPASTGVAGRNPAGAALVVGAWAVQPIHPSTRVEEIASPLQCPASAYGSSFSRAMEITSAAGRRLFISGTASLAPDGRTLGKGDARAQVGLTMEVVEAILRSRGFTFADLTRATAYFKLRSDVRAFRAWCGARDLHSLPVLAIHCDICRDDLLFELEADAWSSRQAVV